MIDVKTAAKKAMTYLGAVQDLQKRPISGLEIEEVELSDDEQFWFITLGFSEDVLGIKRKYKVFKIKAETGDVVSMKIRSVA